jgi:integrase
VHVHTQPVARIKTLSHKINKSAVDRMQVGDIIADAILVGFTARKLPSGSITYGYRYRADGRQRWIGLGVHGVDLTPDQARKKALKVAAQVMEGDSPLSAAKAARKRRQVAGYTVNDLLDDFMRRYVVENKLRSADEIKRVFDRYVRPKLGAKAVHDLKRLDVINMLDTIADAGAPVMADRVLAHFRKALRWYATRDEGFAVPLVAGMARTNGRERARTRVLADDEFRDLWAALDAFDGTTAVPKCFAPFVKTLLLTGQRRAMVSEMPWSEISGDEWLVPPERNKVKLSHLVPLTDAVRDLLGERGTGYVFSSDGGKTPFSGFSKAKAALDAKLAEIRKAGGRKPMSAWVLHDLRRTARSLMGRAGVPTDHAERVLGHTLPGIRRVYDHHDYASEKRTALLKLDTMVARILKPGAKVVKLRR